MMKYLFCLFLILLSLLSQLCAQNILELCFQGGTVKDIAGEKTLELVDVVVFSDEEKMYADFSGKSAIIIPTDPEFSFSAQHTLWIEMWVNPSSIGIAVPLVSKGTGGNYRIGLQKSGEVFFSYYSSGAWHSLISDVPLEENRWQHVALWFDSPAQQAAIFLDGKVVALSSEMSPFQSKDDRPLYIGGTPKQDETEYNGFTGGIGAFILSRENPRNIPVDLTLDQQVFELKF